ncbi:molybdopterin dinucleotide binding domain-containing protein [Sinirhodobacter huangdaonensis]|uniref:Tetrathionate reductase subunit TtrA n=1 Tax=Paenirhodobacter huangdaonensis TaxID=2501515 RepID=A0A443LI76_9RHOB|nr:molybdopterin dinucleotide binding domain-containing protein [Sinirhodobacter huangdaonensis]RWR48876.1 tetrathionate reductase subunit TtrA [Sinirhodobacter huangdaonensis]
MSTRRNILKGAVATGALATFGAGYAETVKKIARGKWSGAVPPQALTGFAPEPEFRLDAATGDLVPNPDQAVSYTMCIGCTTMCGVRVRVDRAANKVLRVAGNPFSPMSTDPHIPYARSVRESFTALARAGEGGGLTHRSTACGRGNAVLQQLDNPRRVLKPLKRVGPRGAGQWQTISFEQLVEEVVEGGDLFGEGRVAGLREIRDLNTPIKAGAPEFGPRANGLVWMNCVDDGRDNLVLRWLKQSYGSTNFVRHGAYCGGAYRNGSGAMFGDFKTQPHAKPDFNNAEFILFVGTAPGNAGNPFKIVGTKVAQARADGKLGYVVVDPVLTHAQNGPSGERSRWLPIKPGSDGALAMAIIRWMFENGKINTAYLAQPTQAAAEAAGEASFTNATHLVIVAPTHPRFGRFLRGSDIGLPLAEGVEPYSEADPFLVASGTGPAPAGTSAAPLFFDGVVGGAGEGVAVKTALTLLREEAMKHEMAEYSTACGIPLATIEGLARELTSHGRRAAVNSHGGMMSGMGHYNAYALMMINTLIGNLNCKGGTMVAGGWFPDSKGPAYDLADFPGAVTAKGLPIGRNAPYEKTSEFKAKKAAGKPYPADGPWYPNAPGLATEWISSIVTGYPYRAEALVFRNTNPVYGLPGIAHLLERLKDPKVVPLIVSIDPFINESSAIADYIVPDSVMYETWGFTRPWGGIATKATTARWPVVEPRMERNAAGERVGMETFLIATAKRMGLPGFGAAAIPDAEGTLHPLERAEDWYLRGAANVAMIGQKPVADASDDDIALSGVSRIRADLEATLKPGEWRKAATIYAKGGRYEDAAKGYDGERAAHPFEQPMQVWNEALGSFRRAGTGTRMPGCPAWLEPEFADGSPVAAHYPESDWPVKLVSFKSPLQNSYSVGAPALLRVVASNPVNIGRALAAAHGIATGDRVRLTTPGGSLDSVAVVRDGIAPDTVAIEHGFGHRGFGAQPITIDGETRPGDPRLATGVLLNDVGMLDPTRPKDGVWVDPVAGTAVRQGLPARLEKIG